MNTLENMCSGVMGGKCYVKNENHRIGYWHIIISLGGKRRSIDENNSICTCKTEF